MEIEFLDKFPNCPLLSEISFRHFPAAQVAKKKATVTGQQNADFLFHFHLPLIELINTLIAFAISRIRWTELKWLRQADILLLCVRAAKHFKIAL